MISVHLKGGDKSGEVAFMGDEVSEPCQIIVSGDFSLTDIQAMFWLINLTAEGTGHGVYPLYQDVCAPYEFLTAMQLSAVEVSAIPQDWQDEIDAMASDAAEQFEVGSVA